MAASPTHQTLSVLVENRSGVLARVSGLFARRGFNIISLAVAPSDDERFSRITIVIDVEETSVEQITKQLFKLVNVVKITELHPSDAVERELLLATVAAGPDKRSEVIELVGVFEGKIVDVAPAEPHRDAGRRPRPARRLRGPPATRTGSPNCSAPAGWRCPSSTASRPPACALTGKAS